MTPEIKVVVYISFTFIYFYMIAIFIIKLIFSDTLTFLEYLCVYKFWSELENSVLDVEISEEVFIDKANDNNSYIIRRGELSFYLVFFSLAKLWAEITLKILIIPYLGIRVFAITWSCFCPMKLIFL